MVSCFMTLSFSAGKVREALTQGQSHLLGSLERTSKSLWHHFDCVFPIGASCPVLSVLTYMSYFNCYEARRKQTGPLFLASPSFD